MSRTSDDIPNMDSATSGRYRKLIRYDIPKAALKRYVEAEGISVRGLSSSPRVAVAQSLSDEQIEQLIQEYKFAGKQSINYFVITGISEEEFSKIHNEVKHSSPSPKKKLVRFGSPIWRRATNLMTNCICRSDI